MTLAFFDHTGDVGVHLAAPTLGDLLAEAARALTDTITPLDGVRPAMRERVVVTADELDLLLVDWLSELLFRFETAGWLTREADVTVERDGERWTVAGTVSGERLDHARHGVRVLVKAVTYHLLRVTEREGTWTATVVFDI